MILALLWLVCAVLLVGFIGSFLTCWSVIYFTTGEHGRRISRIIAAWVGLVLLVLEILLIISAPFDVILH